MSFIKAPIAGKSIAGKRPAEKSSLKTRAVGGGEDDGQNKRHRTRGALSKRQLTPETILYFTPPEAGSSDEEEDDDDEEELPSETLPPPGASIEIPVVRRLTDEELAVRTAELQELGAPPDREEDQTSDAWYRRLHLVFELKEQAIREQAMRSGGGRRVVRRLGNEVSATELLLAPEVERSLSREDHRLVMGKSEAPEVPGERLAEIQSRLLEVEQSYDQEKKYSRYYLHTRWQPQVVVEPPVAPGADGEAAVAPRRLVIKLQRLADKPNS